jgi:hypothetical protein
MARPASYIFSLCLALLPWGSLQAQDPSLEDLEKMGAEMDGTEMNTPAPPPPPAAGSEAFVPDEAAQAEAASMSQPDQNAPATDSNGLEPVDVRSRIKKVLEPNLFAGAPPVPGTLRNMTPGESPEEYAVQEGDNLFDICDQLIDEPNYWPKLWSFNPGIANPHFIYPGMKLRFYAGDADNPPFLQVVTEDDIVPVDKGGMKEAELVREDINGMLMRSEIPTNQQITDAKDLEPVADIADMIEVAGERERPEKFPLIVPAFIVADAFEELGRIVGGSAGSFLIDKDQFLIVEPEDDDSLKAGTSYTIVRETGKVRTKNGNDFVGYRYEFIAHIQVNSKDEEEDVFRAKVIFNRLGVMPGDMVIAYRSTRRSIPINPPRSIQGLNQQVVAFTEPFMLVGGQGSFVFLEQNENKLQEGQVYNIMQNVKVAAPIFLRNDLPDTESQVAKAYIIDASASGALGFILSGVLEVRLGDKVSP